MESTSSSPGKLSERQRNYLIYFLEANPKLAKNTLDASFTREMSNKKWQEAANKLNSLGGAYKTVKQWKRTCTNLKVLTKKKAADLKRKMQKTGGGAITSDEESEDEDALTEDASLASIPAATEKILSLIEQTAIEGIRGIRELGIEHEESNGEQDEDEPLPKRPNLGSGASKSNERVSYKKKLAEEWLKNSKSKVEEMQSVTGALSNIANQIGRLADTFEAYNNANLE